MASHLILPQHTIPTLDSGKADVERQWTSHTHASIYHEKLKCKGRWETMHGFKLITATLITPKRDVCMCRVKFGKRTLSTSIRQCIPTPVRVRVRVCVFVGEFDWQCQERCRRAVCKAHVPIDTHGTCNKCHEIKDIIWWTIFWGAVLLLTFRRISC